MTPAEHHHLPRRQDLRLLAHTNTRMTFQLCMLLVLLLFGCSGVAISQTRSLLDHGVEWQGDYFIKVNPEKPIIRDDYIYICFDYGLVLYKHMEDQIIPCDTLPGLTANGGRFFQVLDSLAIWCDNRLYIAERNGDSLSMLFEGRLDAWMNRGYCISEDSLLVFNNGILSFHDPTNPLVTWQTPDLYFNASTGIFEDHIITIDRDWNPEVKIFDVSDPWQPIQTDSLHITGFIGNMRCPPRKIGNTIAFVDDDDYIRFFRVNEDFGIEDAYTWSSDDYVYSDYYGIEILHDSLFLAFSKIPTPVPRAVYFDPDLPLNDMLLFEHELEFDWTGFSISSINYSCSASGPYFFISSGSATHTRLFDFNNIYSPTLLFDQTRSEFYNPTGKLFVSFQDRYVLIKNSQNYFVYDLTQGPVPQQIARTPYDPEFDYDFAAAIDSVVLICGTSETHHPTERRLYYSDSRNCSVMRELFAFRCVSLL